MGFILSLLTNKYVIIGLIVAALVGSGFFYINGLKNKVVSLEADNKVLTTDLQVSQASVKTLSASIEEQNTAVDKFKADADARLKANTVIINAAKVTATTLKAQAAALLAAKVPPNVTTCNATNELINSEIQNAK